MCVCVWIFVNQPDGLFWLAVSDVCVFVATTHCPRYTNTIKWLFTAILHIDNYFGEKRKTVWGFVGFFLWVLTQGLQCTTGDQMQTVNRLVGKPRQPFCLLWVSLHPSSFLQLSVYSTAWTFSITIYLLSPPLFSLNFILIVAMCAHMHTQLHLCNFVFISYKYDSLKYWLFKFTFHYIYIVFYTQCYGLSWYNGSIWNHLTVTRFI